jgi:hypothetical protein
LRQCRWSGTKFNAARQLRNYRLLRLLLLTEQLLSVLVAHAAAGSARQLAGLMHSSSAFFTETYFEHWSSSSAAK